LIQANRAVFFLADLPNVFALFLGLFRDPVVVALAKRDPVGDTSRVSQTRCGIARLASRAMRAGRFELDRYEPTDPASQRYTPNGAMQTTMNVVYANQPIPEAPRSIFLAGPTPRSREVRSWRPEALRILNDLSYDGTVFVPEPFDWGQPSDYLQQVEWEYQGLETASCIAFWVPRDRLLLPGFTTNVEFGGYVRSGRALYGRLAGSVKNGYLDWLYRKVTSREPHTELHSLMSAAVLHPASSASS